MKRTTFILCFIFLTLQIFAQQPDAEVDARGIGARRDDALQDAMRNAVGQAMGVALQSETKVENFVVIQDAINTRVNGYITNYKVTKESPFPDRFEINLHATVSLNPLKADIKLLAQSIGGVRFLVMYDDRDIPENEKSNYNSAVERISGFLAARKYRYIEKSRFDQLKKEASQIMHETSSDKESYVQQFGIKADAQFIILINKISVANKSEAFDTRTSSKVVIEAKAYDNCTAEGLGTVTLESGYKSSVDLNAAITEAVNNDFTKLLGTFTSYIGEWVNNGTPYELRFYSSGTYRDMRDLRQRLKDDSNFGGQLEIVSLDNYSKLNCTFRKKPDELADKILDIADEVPAFKEKRMDVKFIFGRQISFAPHNVTVPELQGLPQSQTPVDAKAQPDPPPAQTKSSDGKSTVPSPSTPPAKKPVTKPKSGTKKTSTAK